MILPELDRRSQEPLHSQIAGQRGQQPIVGFAEPEARQETVDAALGEEGLCIGVHGEKSEIRN